MNEEIKCKTHPDAPHGFVRNASHTEDRYVCECEYWEEPKVNKQIKELAIKAGLIAPYGSDLEGLREFDYRMFAQLIVAECIAQCEKVASDADAMAKSKFVTDAGRMLHEGMWGGATNSGAQIKQHFYGDEE